MAMMSAAAALQLWGAAPLSTSMIFNCLQCVKDANLLCRFEEQDVAMMPATLRAAGLRPVRFLQSKSNPMLMSLQHAGSRSRTWP